MTADRTASGTERKIILVLLAAVLLCGAVLWFSSDNRRAAPISVTPPLLSTENLPGIGVTQYVAQGSPVLVPQVPGGPGVVITQSPPIGIYMPFGYNSEGRRISDADFLSRPHRDLSLIDTRYQAPPVELE